MMLSPVGHQDLYTALSTIRQAQNNCVPPNEDNFDFRRSIIDDGGGILVTPAVQDLSIDLEEKSCPHIDLFLYPIHLHIHLSSSLIDFNLW